MTAITTSEQRPAVEAYVEEVSRRSERARVAEQGEKTGVFTGAFAVHPVTGQPIPIWIADYVLATYGTGAIMAVPAHDTRDYAFAKQMHLPIVEVVSGGDISAEAYTGDGTNVNSELPGRLGPLRRPRPACASGWRNTARVRRP